MIHDEVAAAARWKLRRGGRADIVVDDTYSSRDGRIVLAMNGQCAQVAGTLASMTM